MSRRLAWASTSVQIVGVFLLSSRLAEPEVAFWVLMAGSVLGAAAALLADDMALLALMVAFCLSNIVGIARWWHA